MDKNGARERKKKIASKKAHTKAFSPSFCISKGGHYKEIKTSYIILPATWRP